MTYDKEADAMYVIIGGSQEFARSFHVTADVAVDINPEGHVVGAEILNASKNVDPSRHGMR